MTACSTGTVQQVARWLTAKNSPVYGSGRYQVAGSSISFTYTVSSGRVEYRGRMSDDRNDIDFDIVSFVNGHRSHRKYTFVTLDGD